MQLKLVMLSISIRAVLQMIRNTIKKPPNKANKARKRPLIVSMSKEGLITGWSVYKPITPWFICDLAKNPSSGGNWLSRWYVSVVMKQADGHLDAIYHDFNADSALFLTSHYCALFEAQGYPDANTKKGKEAVFKFIHDRIKRAIPACAHDLRRLGYPTKLNH